MVNWTKTPSGFELATGAIKLAVTDQSDRGCGWCWHISPCVGEWRGEEIASGGGMPDAGAAKAKAAAWARDYCERTLAAIAESQYLRGLGRAQRGGARDDRLYQSAAGPRGG